VIYTTAWESQAVGIKPDTPPPSLLDTERKATNEMATCSHCRKAIQSGVIEVSFSLPLGKSVTRKIYTVSKAEHGFAVANTVSGLYHSLGITDGGYKTGHASSKPAGH
jgi:hypothetical protein